MNTHASPHALPTSRPPAALAALAAAALSCASCKVGPDYKRPDVEVPGAFRGVTPADTGQPELTSDWWTIFNDEELTKLETAALSSNFDIQAAAARVVQARASTKAVMSQFYPVITLDPSISRFRTSGNNGGQGSSTVTQTTVPFDLSYEVDVWGRVRRAVESSKATSRASAADFSVVLQTLTADLAQDYFNLRSFDAQDAILQRSIDLYSHQLELTQTQYKAGIAGQIDVVQSQANLEAARAQAIDIRRQREDTVHAIAILTGRPPSELDVALRPLDEPPPIVPAGLPSDLLGRRPDVAEAEQNLASACASVGVAKANFYPVLRLTGTAGFESTSIAKTFDWESRIWSFGPSITMPIFEGGLLNAQLEQAKAKYDELLATFRSTILGAFRDVEDSLTDLHMRSDAAEAQERAIVSSREYLKLAETEYRGGLVSYLNVIDADRTLLNNELVAAQILNQRYVSTVLLIKALGGGWNPDDPDNDPRTQTANGPQ